MSVAGFQEAYDAALTVDIGQGHLIKVASLAGLALLKLIAWLDRGIETNKDAADFLTIMHQYQHVQEDRLWEPFIPAEELEYDMERQGTFLLGYDLRIMLSVSTTNPNTISRINTLVADMDRFIGALYKSQETVSYERIAQLQHDFWKGLNLEDR